MAARIFVPALFAAISIRQFLIAWNLFVQMEGWIIPPKKSL